MVPPKPTRKGSNASAPPLPNKSPSNVPKKYYGCTPSLITVDAMDRYFLYFMKIRTRNNFLLRDEVSAFFAHINQSKIVPISVPR